MTLTKFYYLNEIGSKKNQEDFIWPAPGSVGASNKIFIVCDGVGGSSKGEVASRIVAEYMGNALAKMDISLVSIEIVNGLLLQARNALSEYAIAQNTGADMATTFTLVVFHTDKAFIAWCGDSRVYHFRKGVIIYKTEDHSLVNSLVKSGEISETDASNHPQRNIILKAIKADSTVIEAEGGWTSDIQDGDYFLLCTDGLLENWNDQELSSLMVNGAADKIDFAEAIKKKSFNRTRDNYSMYLLQTSVEEKQPAKQRRKTRPLLWILLVAVVAAVITYGLYQRKKITPAAHPALKQDTIVNANGQPPFAAKKDSLAPAAVVEKETGNKIDTPAPLRSEIINPAPEKNTAKPARDTALKKHLIKSRLKPLKDTTKTQAPPALQEEKKDKTDSSH